MLSLAYAKAAIAAHKNSKVNASRVTALLAPYKNTATIANVTQVTQVQTSAANKYVLIQKVTRASVLLFANALNYAECIKRSAAKVDGNDADKVADFVPSEASFTHDEDCYSLVTNNRSGQQYLYLHYNRAESVYIHNGVLMSAEVAASFCTPSVAKAMLKTDATTHNKANDVTHSIVVRTVKLQNIVRLAALKQVLN